MKRNNSAIRDFARPMHGVRQNIHFADEKSFSDRHPVLHCISFFLECGVLATMLALDLFGGLIFDFFAN